jgi:hypothetical protein
LQALLKTGATGLEPATSGVTGHVQDRDVGDDRGGIALFMRVRAPVAYRSRMVERACYETFAARLLPGVDLLLTIEHDV